MSDKPEIRPGEAALERDPSERVDATLRFIGRVRSPWSRGDCPKNIARAREQMDGATVELDPAFIPALDGLSAGQPIILIYWMDRARRDLVKQKPAHVDVARGTFALRSPNRPNPVTLSTVRITSIDRETGVIGIDAIDCFDGTPVIDIKPWLETVDSPPR